MSLTGAEAQRRYRDRHPERVRASQRVQNQKNYWADPAKAIDYARRHRLAKLGLTEDTYEAMVAAQDGECGICGRVCPSGRRLAVDHDHQTGRVRGLLCLRCNRCLGQFEDNPGLLRRAAEYLERET